MIEVRVQVADLGDVVKQIQDAAAEALRRHRAGEPPVQVEDEVDEVVDDGGGGLVIARCPCEHQHLGQCPPS